MGAGAQYSAQMWGGQPGPSQPRGRIGAAAALAAAAAQRAGAESGADDGKRAPRCTGSALGAAATLLEACVPDGGARAMLFTGGPSVGGAGAIVDADLAVPMRAHADIASKASGSARAKVGEY